MTSQKKVVRRRKAEEKADKPIRSAVRGEFYQSVADILHKARSNAYRAVNFAMVEAYWHIGRMIVEEEQQGKERAEYGALLIRNLSIRLTHDFGKGFTETNLKYFRQFYLTFPAAESSAIRHALRGESPSSFATTSSEIRDALRPELAWTHYRLLMRVENTKAREYYLNEAADQNWSTRALERQINSLYYERRTHADEP